MVRVFIWLYSIGLFKQETSPEERVEAQNVFPLAKSLHCELDSSPPSMLLLPTRDTIISCIGLVWQALAEEEVEMASRPLDEPWRFDVAQLLAHWPHVEPQTGGPIFEHRLELFSSRANGKEVADDLIR